MKRTVYIETTNDPIVAEVRRIREEIARECEFDVHKLFELQKRVYDEWKGKKVMKPFHPEWRAPKATVVAEEHGEYGKKK